MATGVTLGKDLNPPDAEDLGTTETNTSLVLVPDGSGGVEWAASPGGGGDVVGPASSTDNAIVRFDLATGKLIQDSGSFLTDAGWLGVNVAPTGPIDVVATDIRFLFQTNSIFNHQRYNNTASASPRYSQRRARGTSGAPTAIQAGDIIGRYESNGYDGVGFITAAGGEMRVTANETWSAGNNGSYLTWYATADGAVASTELMRLEGGGDLGVGTTNPTHRLHVMADGTATLRAVSSAEDNTNQFGNTAASSTGNYTYIQQRLATSAQERTAMQIQTRLSDATDGTRTTETHFSVNDAGSFVNALEFNGTNVVIGNGATDTLGFFGATGADREADFVALTNSTGGTANNTLAACAACNNATVVNNNFSDVAAKINAIRDVLRAYNLMA